jgi:hypothetical protein
MLFCFTPRGKMNCEKKTHCKRVISKKIKKFTWSNTKLAYFGGGKSLLTQKKTTYIGVKETCKFIFSFSK